MKIIAIHGTIGSGKTTLGNIILDKTNLIPLAFGDRLKECVSILTCTPIYNFYNQEYKNLENNILPYTNGECLQIIADKLKELDEDIFIKNTLIDLKDDKNYLVTDLRLKNELKYLKKYDTKFIKIIGDPAKVNNNSKRNLKHNSETSLNDYNDWDYIVHNNKDIKHLENCADFIIKNFL